MRSSLFVLIFCVLISDASAKPFKFKNELHFLGGTGNTYAGSSSFSANMGMRKVLDVKFWYVNAGPGLYFLSGQRFNRIRNYYEGTPINFVCELAAGGGFSAGNKKTRLRIGTDAGFHYSLTHSDPYLTIIPQIILVFNLAKIDIGVIAKGTMPLTSNISPAFYPQFWGGGVILRF